VTLIVSLRTPDGIVLAGDSLATMLSPLEVKGTVAATCPECGHQHEIAHQAIASVPTSSFSFAQKVFDFLGRYGVGTSGAAQLAGVTIRLAGRQLERELREADWQPAGTREVAEKLGARIRDLLAQQLPDLDSAADGWSAVGLQVVGYDGIAPMAVQAEIVKAVTITEYSSLGCTVTGQPKVTQAIWALYEHDPQDQAQYDSFSLQDAIDYAEFLIRTTASYQRFSRNLPNVGGEIDVALVTPFENFRWIRQKALAKVLGGNP